MAELLSHIVSTILQVLVFCLVPFIFFLFRKDKEVTFFRYVGLYKPNAKSVLFALATVFIFLAGGVGIMLIDENIKQMLTTPPTVTGTIRAMGFSAEAIMVLLLIALFKTSFAEEVLFRGFIGRRLIDKFDFVVGNTAQALVFGAVHLLLFLAIAKVAVSALLFVFALSTAAGWVVGYIKEKIGNGSIIPGWIAHGAGNTISYFIIAFVI